MGYYKKVEISGVNTAQLPVLSALQAKELFRRYHDGDESARELLIEGNLRLVLSVIKRFENRNEDMDDLFQVGVVGLLKAIENFNPDLDVMPSSYLCPMISGEVRRYLRDNNTIRVSRSLRDTAYRALQVRERLTAEKSKEILDELVKKGELTVEQGKVLNQELKHNIKSTVKTAADSVKESAARKNDQEELKATISRLTPEQLAAVKAQIERMQAEAAEEKAETAEEPAEEAVQEASAETENAEDTGSEEQAAE